MKALVALSLFAVISACSKPGGKGSVQGEEAPVTSEENQPTTSGTTRPGTEYSPTGKSDKDVQSAGDTSTTPTGTTTTPPDSGSGSTDPGAGTGAGTGTGSGSGSGSGGGTTPPADSDQDGITDDQDLCPGEDDALQVTRYKLTDADMDGYPDGSLSAKVCPSNTVYTLALPQVVLTDCNGSDASKWQNLSYSYRDADGDGHSVASSGTLCTGAALPASYLTSSLGTPDCDDGQAAWHTVASYYSYAADAITSDRYSRMSETTCIPSSGFGSTNAYKEYRLVPDVVSSSGVSSVKGFYEFGGKLYFRASNGTHGGELWVTDGTIAGTSMVKDINAGSASSFPDNFIAASGKLYFTADDGSGSNQLWTTDGTAAGTVKVKAIVPSSQTVANGTLFFVANDGLYGAELWKTDGTAAGTVMVKDINPDLESSSPGSLTVVGSTLYFTADDDSTGDKDLWKTDGTESGTVKVKDLDNVAGTSMSDLIGAGSTLYFTVKTTNFGRELWKSNGTSAGTVMVKDIRVGNTDGFVDTLPSHFAAIGSILYFVADDGASGKELWKTDGTEAGTVMIKDIWSGSNQSLPDNLKNVNGTLFFTADNGTIGTELWKSDGTEAGTTLVKDIRASGGMTMLNATVVGSILYFRTDDGDHGSELWKSDGTDAGTMLVKDINPSGNSNPSNLSIFGNRLIFTAINPDGNRIHLMPVPL